MSAMWCWPQALVQPEMLTRTPPTSARPASSRDLPTSSARRRVEGGRHPGRRVPELLHDLGDAARPTVGGDQEAALLEHPLAQLVDAHGVDEPLHAGSQLVVTVSIVVEHTHDGFDGRQEVLARGDVLEGLRRVRVGAQAAGEEPAEARLDGA